MLPIPNPSQAGANIFPEDTQLSGFSGVLSQLLPIHLLLSFQIFLDVTSVALSLPAVFVGFCFLRIPFRYFNGIPGKSGNKCLIYDVSPKMFSEFSTTMYYNRKLSLVNTSVNFNMNFCSLALLNPNI